MTLPLRSTAVLVIALLLAACVPLVALDTEVTLQTRERWQAQVTIVVTREQAALVSGQIEAAIGELVTRLYETGGIRADWERDDRRDDDNIAYVITAEGEGLSALNEAFFDGAATLYADESSGQRRIVFSYAHGSSLIAQRQSFTLHGGRIISSNGTQTGRGTVTWTNPQGRMEAVLTEACLYPWLPYLLIGFGGVLVAVAAIGLVRSSRRVAADRRLEGMPIPGNHCLVCGHLLPAQAVFCPRCGTQR